MRQHLTQTRQELSNALYENDAAKRVVARLQRERDEARDALSKIGVNGAGGGGGMSGGEAMQLDGQEMSEDLVKKVEATQEKYVSSFGFIGFLVEASMLMTWARLSKTRRKRPVPEDWATTEDLEAFAPVQSTESQCSDVHSIAMDSSEDLALFGGKGNFTSVYSISKKTILKQFETANGAVTDAAWAGSDAITSTSTGHIEIWDDAGSRIGEFQEHSGAATALALHPSGDIAASVGADKRIVFYDLAQSTTALKIYTDSRMYSLDCLELILTDFVALTAAQFHPDGHLFAAGGKDGQIKVYDTKTGANAANFDEGAPIEALHFSENGTWLAVASKNSSVVSVWDLRKSNKVKEVDMGGPVSTLKWDYTGQFLAAAGPGGLTIQAYDKGKKEWSEPLRTAVPASAVDWGSKGRSLVTVNEAGVVTVLGGK